ncbi:hypothetical protein [Arthrobacter sp. B2a2-09]|uniref:hypothetical protein n=1 Tax=Arthrobacter sp. B2a2-09 TaxID=2952822 RepID=UPI0022CD8B41|nr:hypothetical protein [Arthrobacter sp. B2a2-09]MCZ9880957.1 hypothetical protein [Arthrobacter sp. B2a2-09]
MPLTEDFDVPSLQTRQPPTDTTWNLLTGLNVEIEFHGVVADAGIVDDVTFDGLVLWLKQNGVTLRRIVEKVPGVRVHVL